MKYLSLFSGIGGFDRAFEDVGMECDSVCEIDRAAQGILTRHFPNARLFDDVRKVGIATHGRKSVNLVCGGFPCQDLSVAGRRAGLAGERSGLWFEFARVIDELEPGWVVIENVPGLLSTEEGRDFAVILRWLVKRGYGVCWRVLDAQYFGLAQRRRRVFIVASLGSGRAAQVLFESEGVPGDSPPSREAGQVTSTLFASVAGTSRPAGTASEIGFLVGFNHKASVARSMPIMQDVIPSLEHQGMAVSFGLNSKNNRYDSESQTLIIAQPLRAGRQYSDMGDGQTNVFPVDTGVRRLTPVECERLQGFPDGWTDGQSDTARYRQLGNAVAVPVARWIGKRILEAEMRVKSGV